MAINRSSSHLDLSLAKSSPCTKHPFAVSSIKAKGKRMDQKFAINMLIRQVEEYAAGKIGDVARGSETPRLAALLMQKYGRGIVDAVALLCDKPGIADLISHAVDKAASEIDPAWREHDRARWAGFRLDVICIERNAG